MANLQYIGARYVPKFYENPNTGDMTWKSGVGYEALTVVKYNDDTYTSKKPVPSSVGNPASNPTYWAKTADYNAALISLQNSVNYLNANILNGADYINNRKILFVGDSYGTIADNWVSQLVSLMGIDAANYVNISVSGSGLLATNTDTWLNMVTNYNGAIQRGDFTDIIICGGINDMRPEDSPSVSNIRAALYALISYCKANYNHARVYVGFIDWTCALNETGGTVRTNISTIGLPAYHEVATWGGIYLTGVEAAVHDARLFDSGDNTHPNSSGSRQIALAVAQAWLGGSYHKSTIPSTADGATFDTVNYNPNQSTGIYSEADGYNVRLVGRAVNVGLVTPLSVTANQQYTLSKLYTHVTSLLIGTKDTGTVIQDTFDLPFDLVYSDSTLELVSGACTLHANGSADVVFYAPKTGTINSLRLKAFQRTMSMYQK